MGYADPSQRVSQPQTAWWQHFASALGLRTFQQQQAAVQQQQQHTASADALPAAPLPNSQSQYPARYLSLDILEGDDFEVLLNLAAWLSHSKSPAVQQYTYQLYIRIFVMWPGQEERVRLIHSLVHRATGFALVLSPGADQRMVPLLPVTPGSCENRVLLSIVKDYVQYSGVAFIYLMDLLCRHSATYSALALQNQVADEEAARVAAELAALRVTAVTEKKALKAKVAELESAVKRRAVDSKKELKTLTDTNVELEAQVCFAVVCSLRLQGST